MPTKKSVFKSDEEADALLGHENNGIVKISLLGSGNHLSHKKIVKKKGEDRLDTVEKKADVAVLAELIGNKATSDILGVDDSVVSRAKNGKNGNGVVQTEVVQETDKRLEGLQRKVIDKVELFLEVLQDEKIMEMKGKDLASSADKLINTYDKLHRRNENKSEGGGRPQVHYYAPVQVNIENYPKKEV